MTLDQYGAIFGALVTAEIHFKVESESTFATASCRTFAARKLAKVREAMTALNACKITADEQLKNPADTAVLIPTPKGGFLVRTHFVCPLIPGRSFDWVAWVDGREEWKTGRGQNRQAAIDDLMEQIKEAA